MEIKKDEDLGPWLALFHAQNLSLRQKHELLARWPSPRKLLNLSDSECREAGLTNSVITALNSAAKQLDRGAKQIELSLEWLQSPPNRIITLSDKAYPAALRETGTSPLLLFLIGQSEILSAPQIAVVGSRNATPAGLETAGQLSAELSRAGLVVTSGLAVGIDTASHRAALKAGGRSVAVLGCGVDVCYPRRSAKLAASIAEQGALVSEFPLATPPRPQNFPQRNRIISGLSLGVLVVEAALKSGSLISANYAINQGREVFAVPGSIHNPASRGCHWLLRQGAKLVESAADVLEEINLNPRTQDTQPELQHRQKPPLTDLEQQILSAVDYVTTSLDALVNRSALDVHLVNQQLMSLELKGYIHTIPGGFVRSGSRVD